MMICSPLSFTHKPLRSMRRSLGTPGPWLFVFAPEKKMTTAATTMNAPMIRFIRIAPFVRQGGNWRRDFKRGKGKEGRGTRRISRKVQSTGLVLYWETMDRLVRGRLFPQLSSLTKNNLVHRNAGGPCHPLHHRRQK